MPKLDFDEIEQVNSTGYPAPFDTAVAQRWYRRLAPVAGLTDFGASHVVLKPGAWSSHRHWHVDEDELVILLSGEAVLVENDTETLMRSGDVAAFAAGVPNGHHLQNRSSAECVFIAIGRPAKSDCHYSDIDLHLADGVGFVRKDGTAFVTE
jgi:uncharacterized cupin superfamily protein